MKKILMISNDAINSYRRFSENSFLDEVNPRMGGGRYFDAVSILNWKQKTDDSYAGVKGFTYMDDKKQMIELTDQLARGEVPFSHPLYGKIYEPEKERIIDIARNIDPSVMSTAIHPFAIEAGSIIRDALGIPYITVLNDPSRITSGVSEANYLVSQSQEMKDACIEKYGIDPSKISVIPNGIDTSFFYHRNESEVKGKLGKNFSDAKYKILSIGRIVREKNMEGILGAVAKVREKLGDVQHIHIGKMPYQDWGDKILKLKEKLGLEKTTHFLDEMKRENLPYYYSWADTFLHPALWEGMNRSMREALACETPAITSNQGSNTEIVQNSYNGLQVDTNNTGEIAERLEMILTDKKLQEKFGKNGRSFIKKNHSIDITMRKSIGVYQKILSIK